MAQIRVCGIDGCGKPHFGRGWCRLHYQRWYHHGDPNQSPADRRRELAQRIAEMAVLGLSDGEIGETLGLTAGSVGYRRRQAGLESQWEPPGSPHGTESRYVRGCRCDHCRGASAEAHRVRRDRRRSDEPRAHGLSGYTNYGCRCEACSRAHSEMSRRDQGRRQDQSLERATRHRAEWTGPELEVVARRDMPIAETARLLGRTYSAVSAARTLVRDDPRLRNIAGLEAGK